MSSARSTPFLGPALGAGIGLSVALFVACQSPGGTSSGGDGGRSGAGGAGGCPAVPQPEFALTIRAIDGDLPPDTAVDVTWSAGAIGPFELDDPTTWHTLDVSNLVCNVDPKNPPIAPLPELRCEVWTSGAARVRVRATGYAAFDKTLTPSLEDCAQPPTSALTILLERGDGGT